MVVTLQEVIKLYISRVRYLKISWREIVTGKSEQLVACSMV